MAQNNKRTDKGKHWLNHDHNEAFIKSIGGMARLERMTMGQIRKAHTRWKLEEKWKKKAERCK